MIVRLWFSRRGATIRLVSSAATLPRFGRVITTRRRKCTIRFYKLRYSSVSGDGAFICNVPDVLPASLVSREYSVYLSRLWSLIGSRPYYEGADKEKGMEKTEIVNNSEFFVRVPDPLTCIAVRCLVRSREPTTTLFEYLQKRVAENTKLTVVEIRADAGKDRQFQR